MNKYEFFNKEKSIIRHNLVPEMLINVTFKLDVGSLFYFKKINKKIYFFSPSEKIENNFQNKSILKRAAKWYHSQTKTNNIMSQFITNGNKAVKITKFLLCVDKENKELYILHRETPACLIYVEQDKTPVNFVVFDLYEEDQEAAIEVLISDDFKKELREFFISQSLNKDDLN